MKQKKLWQKAAILMILTMLLSLGIISPTAANGQDPTAENAGTIADERFHNFDVTLIDFNTYEDRNKEEPVYNSDPNEAIYYDPEEPPENWNFNQPITFEQLDTNEEGMYNGDYAPLFRVSQQEMALNNWVVELNSSANHIINRYYSYTKKIKVGSVPSRSEEYPYRVNRDPEDPNQFLYEESDVQPINPDYKDNYILGVRIHFPSHIFNAHAVVKPLFEISAYDQWGKLANIGNGVLDNVGRVRWVKVEASGRNYPHSLAVRLRDNLRQISEYFLGYLNFNGWRVLRWDNPYYFPNVDQVERLFSIPLYPRERPHVIFDSFVVRRSGDHVGGDFVVYFRNVRMAFDFAIPPELSTDIDDESYWGILRSIHDERRRTHYDKARKIIENLREERAKKGQNLILGRHPIRFRD